MSYSDKAVGNTVVHSNLEDVGKGTSKFFGLAKEISKQDVESVHWMFLTVCDNFITGRGI